MNFTEENKQTLDGIIEHIKSKSWIENGKLELLLVTDDNNSGKIPLEFLFYVSGDDTRIEKGRTSEGVPAINIFNKGMVGKYSPNIGIFGEIDKSKGTMSFRKGYDGSTSTNRKVSIQPNQERTSKNVTLNATTKCPNEEGYLQNFDYEALKEAYYYISSKFNFKQCGGADTLPPTPSPQDPTEGTGTSCPTTGIYGGYGTKLTDIKLFLYANKVTKGTITLSKPQLEVGTYATDWRPNPTDLVQTNTESLAKKLEGLTKKIEKLEPKETKKGGRKSGKKRD